MLLSRFLAGILAMLLPLESMQQQLASTAQIITRVHLSKTPYETSFFVHFKPKKITSYAQKRNRRTSSNGTKSNFQEDELGWSTINSEVDMVVPVVLTHLQSLGIEYLKLPDLKETISVNPLFLTYEAGLLLTNGIAYNIIGVKRYGDAYMTYENKSFLCRFNLILKSLQFEYNFLLKLMALEGYGKVIGALDDTIVYAELAVNVSDFKMKFNDFRIVNFGNINVQLDQMRLIRQLSGTILSPITKLFRDRITTSISDGLKDQLQIVMDDINAKDPLDLQRSAKFLLAGLTGIKGEH